MTGDMSPGDFRRHGHEVIDWIAQYLDGIRDLPVLPRIEPGKLTGSLPPSGPEDGSRSSASSPIFGT